jgi:thiol-disulfide isomerase/thioredoxin
MSKPPYDPTGLDRALETGLEEILGGTRAPDLRSALRNAAPARLAQAAARVEASTVLTRSVVRARVGLLALAAAGLLGVTAILFGNFWPHTAAPESHVLTTEQMVMDHLDAFHRVMPSEPASLRNAASRALVAPAALPVLRDLLAFLRAHPENALAANVTEFAIYALCLDEPTELASTRERAAQGIATADLELVTRSAITAADEAARKTALAAVAEHLRQGTDGIPLATRCLLTAGDLNPQEARALAAASTDRNLADLFEMAARTADTDPRRLLGQPLVLAGPAWSGGTFTTAAWRGKVVLVVFWASWCRPCQTALEEVAAVRRHYAARGLEVLGINCDHSAKAVAEHLAAHSEWSWPQLFDDRQAGWHQLAYQCGVRRIPQIFLIDRAGVLREVHARDNLDGLVAALIAE